MSENIVAYKLFKERKNGTIGSLFINSSKTIELNRWLKSEEHPTKGFAYRPGWHCCFKPIAPHIKLNPKNGLKRVWYKVLVNNIKTYDRPESQGGCWILAKNMKVLCKYEEK